MKEYILEGKYVFDLADFVAEFLNMGQSNPMFPEQRVYSREEMEEYRKKRANDQEWKDGLENLNRFNEYIEFLTPDNIDVILRIKDSEHIRNVLGYETWEKLLQRGYEKDLKTLDQNREDHKAYLKNQLSKIDSAKIKHGPTLFSYLLEMILENPKIHLRLE